MCDNEAPEIVPHTSSFYHPHKIKQVLIKSENSDVDENEGLTRVDGIKIKCEIKNEPEEVLVIPEYTDQPETDEIKPINEEIDIKYEETQFEGIQSTEHMNDQSKDKNSSERHTFNQSDVTSVKILNCDECAYLTVRRYALLRHKLTHKNITTAKLSSDKDLLHIQLYACNLCTYKTKVKARLKNHMLTHKNIPKQESFKCDRCPYQAKRRWGLDRHIAVHDRASGIQWFDYDSPQFNTEPKNHFKHASDAKVLKCKKCPFRTNYRGYLNRHKLTHKDISAGKLSSDKNPLHIQWYDCNLCTYKTKVKGRLKNHLLTHKNIPKQESFKCDRCPYQAKRRWGLDRHIAAHDRASGMQCFDYEPPEFNTEPKNHLKNASDVKILKCKESPFQTNSRGSLNRHRFKHKDSSETLYPCDLCDVTLTTSAAIRIHMLSHKRPVDVKQYVCGVCPNFKSRNEDSLKIHMLTHKDASQIQWYKCSSCDFKAIEKSYLDRHLLTHNLPEPKIFKYNKYFNQTVCLGNSDKHKSIHDKPSGERHRYKCKFCELTTTTQEYLNMHMRVHKYLLETDVKWYNCKMCNFKSKHKHNYKIHMLLHKDPSEVRWYECDSCDFKAIKEGYLKQHQLIHQDSLKTKVIIQAEHLFVDTKSLLVPQ